MKGYQHLKRPLAVEQNGRKYDFCPGKATWSPRIRRVFQQCLIAYNTGHLPRPGHVEDQDALFYISFPVFVSEWREREYQRRFKDLAELLRHHAEAVLAPWKGKGK